MVTAAATVVQATFLNFSRQPRVRVSSSSPPSSSKFSTVPAIGSLSSELHGLRISTVPLPTSLSNPRSRSIQPIVARRVCQFTGKKANRANHVSFSNHKTKRQQFVNLQYKRLWWDAGKRWLKLRLSTKALKTIEKHGLDAVAKKAGIDLSKK